MITPGTSPVPPLIYLDHVTKEYHRGQEVVSALTDVSLTITAGTLTVVLGPSGGGKSTLLHLLGGMDRATTGSIRVRGQDISHWSSDQLAWYRRNTIGFVFQSFHLLPDMTALDNVELPLKLAGVPPAERRRRAVALLDQVGLADRQHHRPGQLSGGQAQRVAIARALAADPPILLADEPTGNLDTQSGQEILALLTRLAHDEGRAVVLVTHNETFATAADTVVRLQDGCLQMPHTPSPTHTVSVPVTKPSQGQVRNMTLMALAWQSLRHRLTRGILTGLGIAIGVAAMVLLIGLGSGLRSTVVQGLLALGPLNTITVTSHAPSGGLFTPSAHSGPTHLLTPTVTRRLARLPGARAAYVNATFMGTLTDHHRSASIALAVLPPTTISHVSGLMPHLVAGHLARKPGQIVLPVSVAQALIGRSSLRSAQLVGQKLNLHIDTLTGSFLANQNFHGPVHPLTTQKVIVTGLVSSDFGAVSYAGGLIWLPYFSMSTQSVQYPSVTVLAHQVSQVGPLARRIDGLGYHATTMQRVLQEINHTFGFIETGLGAVGGVALVVAGLMIGVVMSMAVLERRRDIGVYRAIGARRRDIAALFLWEALFIGLLGGIVGLGLGSGVGWGLNLLVFPHAQGGSTLFVLPWWLMGLSLAFGGGIAMIAGFVPASRAAALNPVDALRQE